MLSYQNSLCCVAVACVLPLCPFFLFSTPGAAAVPLEQQQPRRKGLAHTQSPHAAPYLWIFLGMSKHTTLSLARAAHASRASHAKPTHPTAPQAHTTSHQQHHTEAHTRMTTMSKVLLFSSFRLRQHILIRAPCPTPISIHHTVNTTTKPTAQAPPRTTSQGEHKDWHHDHGPRYGLQSSS